MFGLGPRELIFILVIFFLFFGTKKIPDLARSISDTVKIFRANLSDETIDELEKVDREYKAGPKQPVVARNSKQK